MAFRKMDDVVLKIPGTLLVAAKELSIRAGFAEVLFHVEIYGPAGLYSVDLKGENLQQTVEQGVALAIKLSQLG